MDKNNKYSFEERKRKASKLITDIIDGKSENMDELNDMFSDNEYYPEFLKNISSQEYSKQANEFINQQFLIKCNEEKLLLRLKKRDKKLKNKRIFKLISSIASVIIMFFIVYISVDYDKEKIEICENPYNKPVLVLHNNEVIRFDKEKNKIIADNYKREAEIETAKESDVNRLIVPKGYTYTIILSDSSEVILNSDSELIYPQKFSNIREITLKGEAYFKIKPSKKAFVVRANNTSINVYGTTFNVNNRSDKEVKTILVSGSVGLKTDNMKEVFIKPNEMAVINNVNECEVSVVNPNMLLGWVDGYLRYINSNFCLVLEELGICYNVKFNYDKELFKDLKFSLSVNRKTDIEKVINIIENSVNVKFKKIRGGEYDIIQLLKK